MNNSEYHQAEVSVPAYPIVEERLPMLVHFKNNVSTVDPLIAKALTVAYFKEWPTPSQFAQAKKMYAEELGVSIKWVAFDTEVMVEGRTT